ncbi:MAG: protein-L-isoaspartate(D-aspartate) O-methyltransferase [Gemmatimonadetes bacterium]|nr:protein-L-isoaspartate(D-aspartate) O-methyltransferase [Gemmatimonadota bacterium]
MCAALDRGLERARQRMLTRHLAGRGIADQRVIDAMAVVPRELFAPRSRAHQAYADRPLPIGMEQTISQPYMVAWMAEALELAPGDRVLEVGTGSGYSAAVLARLCGAVYTVERHAPLADGARALLRKLGCDSVRVRCGDGSVGWPEHAPYDAIVVAAAGPRVPGSLRDQLGSGGRLVMPLGTGGGRQALVRERRTAMGGFSREDLGSVRFVPLVGDEGWD